jgi:hypothetical protein
VSTASVGLLDSSEALVALFHGKHANADVTIGSHFRGGLRYSDPLVYPTAAQHADPLPHFVLCVHRVAAIDLELNIDSASPASPLSEPVVAPTEAGCWHTPSLPATILSPYQICRDHKFLAFASVGLLDSNRAWVMLFREKHTNADVTISSHLRGGLLYSDPLIHPTAAQHADPLPKPAVCFRRSLCRLWPRTRHRPCPPVSPLSEPGSVVQSSKDSERIRLPGGLHGESCYVLFRDHFSNMLYGAGVCCFSALYGRTLSRAAFRTKAPPIDWHLQLSQLKQIHTLRTVSGYRGILRLSMLPSLRLMRRTLTPTSTTSGGSLKTSRVAQLATPRSYHCRCC